MPPSKNASQIRSLYKEGENDFNGGRYEEGIQKFREAYRLGKEEVPPDGNTMDPLSIQSLFRIASGIYKIVEQANGHNYHAAIDAYQTAIRVANQYQWVSDLLPNAYFQIGQSYQKMKFHHEVNSTYSRLQILYPDSLEAREASFWKAINQIDRREWKQATEDLGEYLKAPSAKFLASAHYKMGEAYYNLNDYERAKESFDHGRTVDFHAPESDPTLLFRMGKPIMKTKTSTPHENYSIYSSNGIQKPILPNGSPSV